MVVVRETITPLTKVDMNGKIMALNYLGNFSEEESQQDVNMRVGQVLVQGTHGDARRMTTAITLDGIKDLSASLE